MTAIIPCLDGSVDFICLVDSIDGCLVVPEMVNGYIGPDAAKFTLEPNPSGVVWARGCGIEGSAALWVCVVVVVLRHID